MGIFRYNYNKPGPGVDKDAPKKKGLFLYLELLKRKFGKLAQTTMLYFICSIPMLIIMNILFLFFPINFEGLISEAATAVGASVDMEAIQTEAASGVWMLGMYFSVTMLVLWGSGPASAAFSYITRCFTREEHSWIMSDFFQRFKENFKQAIIVAVVDVLVLCLGVNAIVFYFQQAQSGATIWVILGCMSLMLMLVYTFMHFYIYQIMVTYECKLKDLYKNSLILALGKAPMNLVLTIICAAMVFAMFNYLNPLFALILSFLFFVGFAKYPIEFYAARTISRIFVPESKGDTE